MSLGFLFGGSTGETQATLARKRAMAEALMADSSTPQNYGEGIGSIFAALGSGIGMRSIDKRQAEMTAASSRKVADLLANPGASFPGAPLPGGSARVADALTGVTAKADNPNLPSRFDFARAERAPARDVRGGILETANALGIDPIDLGTAISYETAGTFDPTKKGPTTQWGEHKGLIQFGEPQAKKYGVDWNDPIGSQLGADGAVANYLRDTGVKPGMGMMDIYSAINAGGVGRYNASDANNGGAPGTVADKVNDQMAGHRRNAMTLLGDTQVASLDPSVGVPQAYAPQERPRQFASFDQGAGGANSAPSPLAAPRVVQDRPVAPMPVQPQPQRWDAQSVRGSPWDTEMPGHRVADPRSGGPSMQDMLRVYSDPNLSDQDRGAVEMMIRQKQDEELYQREQNDPLRRMQLEKGQIERDQARNPRADPSDALAREKFEWEKAQGRRGTFVNAGDGNIFDTGKGEWVSRPGNGSGAGGFRYEGNSVEAQSLNGLIESGQLTPEQAHQLGAGKTITGPNGAVMFLTPQGVFGQPAEGGAPQRLGGGSKLFSPNSLGGSGFTPTGAAPVLEDRRPGVISITEPKVLGPTETQRTRVGSVDQSFDTLSTELDRYEQLVKTHGIEALPGKARDQMTTVRQGIMLQMKELFNLGVLNGPDLTIMESMIYDPVVDISKDGGLSNLPDQIRMGATGQAGERAASNVVELKRMFEKYRDAVRSSTPGGPQRPPPSPRPAANAAPASGAPPGWEAEWPYMTPEEREQVRSQ